MWSWTKGLLTEAIFEATGKNFAVIVVLKFEDLLVMHLQSQRGVILQKKLGTSLVLGYSSQG